MKANNKAVFTYLGKDQVELIEKLAKARRTSVSATLRQIVDDYFKLIKKERV